jgi:outer membrane receptor protein involved in Fe transport
MVSLDLIHSNDTGEHYYDPDNIYKRGTVLTDFDGSGDIHTVPDNGFDNHQDDLHLKLRANKNNELKFGLDYSDIDEGLGSFLNGATYFANSSDNDFKWHSIRFSSFISDVYHINNELKIYYRKDELKDDSGFSYTFINRGRDPGTFRSWQQTASRWGLDLITNYNPNDSLSVLIGYNYESDNTESEFSSWSTGINPQFKRTLHSGLFQTIYDISNNLTFLIGTRYDHEEGINSEWMPRTGLVYTHDNNDGSELITKFLYGKSFRALTTYEKEPNQDNPTAAGVVPEKAGTYEFQVIYLPNNKQKYDISFWHTSITNLRIDGTSGYNRIDGIEKNFTSEDTWGMQAAINIKLAKNLGWTFNYTYTNGENNDIYYQDEDLSVIDEIKFNDLIHIAEHKFNSGVDYKYNLSWTFNLMVKYTGKKKASPFDAKFRDNASYDLDGDGFDDYQGNGYAPSYIITDLNISYRTTINSNLSSQLKISNLFDEKYLDMRRAEDWWIPYYHPQPGRTITLNLQYEF